MRTSDITRRGTAGRHDTTWLRHARHRPRAAPHCPGCTEDAATATNQVIAVSTNRKARGITESIVHSGHLSAK